MLGGRYSCLKWELVGRRDSSERFTQMQRLSSSQQQAGTPEPTAPGRLEEIRVLLILSTPRLPNQSVYHHTDTCTCGSKMTLPWGGCSSTVPWRTSLQKIIQPPHYSNKNPWLEHHSICTAKSLAKRQVSPKGLNSYREPSQKHLQVNCSGYPTGKGPEEWNPCSSG